MMKFDRGDVPVYATFAVIAAVIVWGTLTGGSAAAHPAQSRQPWTVGGEGMQTTERVALVGDYRLTWTATDLGTSPNVGCYHGSHLEPGFDGFISQMVEGGQSDSGTSYVYGLKAGLYNWEVSSGCHWRLTLTPI